MAGAGGLASAASAARSSDLARMTPFADPFETMLAIATASATPITASTRHLRPSFRKDTAYLLPWPASMTDQTLRLTVFWFWPRASSPLVMMITSWLDSAQGGTMARGGDQASRLRPPSGSGRRGDRAWQGDERRGPQVRLAQQLLLHTREQCV